MSILDQASEESLRQRIANGPPLPGPGSTYEQGFHAGAAWLFKQIYPYPKHGVNCVADADKGIWVTCLCGIEDLKRELQK